VGQTERAFYEAERDSPFYLHRKLPDEDGPEAMIDYVLPEANIRDVIRSRDKLSATGSDGMSHKIMKARNAQVVKFMRDIVNAIIRCGRVMGSCRKARTVLMCKKGEREDPKN
jgi:hypothetical protein